MGTTQYQKLQRLMRELFRTDQADLDFGIYRVINQKRDEINRFLDEDLLPQVEEAFAEYQDQDTKALQDKLKDAIKQAEELGVDPAQAPKVVEIKEQIAEFGVDVTELENQVYSALYNFFRRYYDKGDFISQRRYKEGVYAIPYEGEEVKLHWANHDQYYIKTSEYLRNYTFKLKSGKSVHFKLVSADDEKDNRKETDDKKRRFILAEDPLLVEDGELVIRFEFRPDEKKRKQDKLNKEAVETIFTLREGESDPLIKETLTELSQLAPTEADKKRTILAKHVTDYTRRNTSDYFIHKDLGGFLRRELDFFIKNEIMRLDDIEEETAPRVEQYLSKIKVIRKIAHKIITFLAQIEDFQKKLWLKKKFVVETQYCVTLDRVPEELYPEIAANEEQRQEWVKLFDIDKVGGDLVSPGYSEPLTVEFLKANPFLVLDTKLFDEEFKYNFLGHIDDLEVIDGLLIFGENFNGLRLINDTYRSRVKCIYIDPPFNLGENPDYLYKVDYKNSTWVSLLESRINKSRELIADNGCIFVRCSHDGNMLLRLLLDSVFGESNFRNEIILRRAEETKGDLNKQFPSVKSITVNYDNIYWYSKNNKSRFGKIFKPITGERSKSHWHSFWKAQNRPNMRYEILGIDLNDYYGQWMWNKERAYQAVKNYQEFLQIEKETGEKLDDYWKRTGKSKEFIMRKGDSKGSIKYWIPPREYVMADNNWLDIKGYANKWSFKTENSEPLLRRIIESQTSADDIVLDFFLGSGTTTAVAQKLGRKWIGIEMGSSQKEIILSRMKDVLFGEKSGISKEVNWKGGGFIKYIDIESVDDSYNNLAMKRTVAQEGALLTSNSFKEDYYLEYLLDYEEKSRFMANDLFIAPFDLKLQISSDSIGELIPRRIDLVETFNQLIGLDAKHISRIQGVVVVEGMTRNGDKTLVIWRDVNEMDNEKLDQFFETLDIRTRDFEYDLIYVNGDNNLPNLRADGENWKVRLIEEDFLKLMFDVEE